MNYARYLNSGQNISLRISVEDASGENRFDSLFGSVSCCHESILTIAFPPPHDQDADYPFQPGQTMDVLTEHNGMGVSLTAHFMGRSDDGDLCVELSGELEYFNRRRNIRIEVPVWLGLEESSVSISTIRDRWQHIAGQIREQNSHPEVTSFARRDVSLSSSGLGLDYPSPVQPGHYFLIYLALDDDRDMICIVGEVVRCEPTGSDSFSIGIHFDCIHEDDRQRIEKHVKQHRPREG